MFQMPLPSPYLIKRYVNTAPICGVCCAVVKGPMYWYIGRHGGVEVRNVYCDARCSLIAHQRRNLEMTEA